MSSRALLAAIPPPLLPRPAPRLVTALPRPSDTEHGPRHLGCPCVRSQTLMYTVSVKRDQVCIHQCQERPSMCQKRLIVCQTRPGVRQKRPVVRSHKLTCVFKCQNKLFIRTLVILYPARHIILPNFFGTAESINFAEFGVLPKIFQAG